MVFAVQNKENIKAVILVGAKDFGRCPVASRIPRALWPIGGVPVLQRLLDHLYRQGIQKIALCCEEETEEIQTALNIPSNMEVTFIEDQLPRGTAGCLRDAMDSSKDDIVLVFHAAIVIPPDISDLIETHLRTDADLTVFFNPPSDSQSARREPAQIYACKTSVLPFIPEEGYCDLKENLVSRLVRAGLSIQMEPLSHPVGNFRTWADYMEASRTFLATLPKNRSAMSGYLLHDQDDVWAGPQVEIHPSAKIIGPVLMEEKCRIQENAFVMGPSILGKHVTVAPGASVVESIIWENSTIGPNSQIKQCLVEGDQNLPGHTMAHQQILPRAAGFFKSISRILDAWFCRLCPSFWWRYHKEQALESTETSAWHSGSFFSSVSLRILGILLLCLAFLWTFWSPTLTDLWRMWWQSDEYSSGMLVLPIAVFILWTRRHDLIRCRLYPVLGWGILFLFLAQAFRFFGLFLMFDSAERLAMVGTIYALIILLFGWHIFWKNKGLLLFLLFMIPLPNRIQTRAAQPLQSWATVSAVFSLETLGYDVRRDGNVINVDGTQVAVAEACNGLRMLTAFFVISGLVALVAHRTWWEKALIMISSVPIALLCNTVRLVVTSIAFTVINGQEWENIFHDFGGLAMMPIALAIIVGELWLLSNLVVVESQTVPSQVVYRQREI
ncbi:MAG: exosortase [Sedimentisphaerales bacterium]|nr:exosortase [Sedimentisphaerales bacterium]